MSGAASALDRPPVPLPSQARSAAAVPRNKPCGILPSRHAYSAHRAVHQGKYPYGAVHWALPHTPTGRRRTDAAEPWRVRASWRCHGVACVPRAQHVFHPCRHLCAHARPPNVHALRAFSDSYAGRAFRYSEATHTTPADVPAKPAAPLVALMGAQVMEVSWAAPLANGSPIEWFALHMGVVTPSGASGGVTEVRIGHVRPGLAIRSLHVRPHRAGTRCCGQPLLGCRVTAQTQPRLMGTGDFQRTLYQIDHGVGRFRNIGSQGSSHT